MHLGNEVAEMSAIVKKEWQLHRRKVPGTHQWVLHTVWESLGAVLTILLLTIIAIFIVTSNIISENGIKITLMIIILGVIFYSIIQWRHITHQVRRYRDNQSQINTEVEFQFDNIMREKYSWYNLSRRKP